MPIVTNNEFIEAIFGEDAPWCHITDFTYDPSNIPSDRHLSAWKGDYASRYTVTPDTNQYFTISTFYADDKNIARRRKALYRQTHCVVLDDVKEKLCEVEAAKLPRPSWILETSPGSEQWGYILQTPCVDRGRAENLLDGLVDSGLAPQGKDPGMKGVTRYVRLPEGINNKASKLVNGQPFKCQMLEWNPFNRVTLEQLATPFSINLDAARREARVDGASGISDHPLINDAGDVIHIKEVRSDGRFDITCPWVDEHTDAVDNGSAIFTNADGSIGFKCHHGACQSRTGADLLRHIEKEVPGFGIRFTGWKVQRAFQDIGNTAGVSGSDAPAAATGSPAPLTFIQDARTPATTQPAVPAGQAPTAPEQPVVGIDDAVNQLRMHQPFSAEQRQAASMILRLVEDMPAMEKQHYHDAVRDIMRWSKPDFKNIIADLRKTWYGEKTADLDFFSDTVFVAELNQFFDRRKRIFYSAEAYQNTYAHLETEARKEALQGGRVTKVDRVDYAPKKPAVFEEDGITYANSWCNSSESHGAPGDVQRWLDHWDLLGWGGYRKHMLQWMAFTVLHPDQKINHMLLLGSGEGCGKDWLLYPLTVAMNNHSMTISGEELLEGFNDYILSTKHLNINEAELGDRREAMAVSAKLKPLAAAPPEKLRVNQKGIKPIQVRNLLSVTMTTNSQMPLRLNGPSRRIFATWSDLQTRNMGGDTKPEWTTYWNDRWPWMKNGGAEACIWYLRNCVDLSDFNPASPPPMTEFLRDIQESSKSPMQQTVEAFVKKRHGAFAADLMTAGELADTIRNGEMFFRDSIFADVRLFTPTRMGTVLRDIPGCARLRGARNSTHIRVWAIRDADRYNNMSVSEIFDEYERQQKLARTATEKQLKVIDGGKW